MNLILRLSVYFLYVCGIKDFLNVIFLFTGPGTVPLIMIKSSVTFPYLLNPPNGLILFSVKSWSVEPFFPFDSIIFCPTLYILLFLSVL